MKTGFRDPGIDVLKIPGFRDYQNSHFLHFFIKKNKVFACFPDINDLINEFKCLCRLQWRQRAFELQKSIEIKLIDESFPDHQLSLAYIRK